MDRLALALLGPVVVRHGDLVIDRFPTRAAKALLVYLAENGPEIRQSREALAERLWPGMPPASGRKNLRQALYTLRRLLPAAPNPLIDSRRDTLRLNPQASLILDTAVFEGLLESGLLPDLQEAADLYRGDFLEDLFLPDNAVFESWAQSRRQHYRERMLLLLESLVDRMEHAGNLELALDYARRLVRLDSLREASVRRLMQLLAAGAARHDALRLFETLKKDLGVELRVEPEIETQALYEAILRGEVRPAPKVPAIERFARNLETAPIRLPEAPTAFIGRIEEIEEIQRLMRLPGPQLLTLLGQGGAGKTRLAIQAAAGLAGNFSDGIFFISLQQAKTKDDLVLSILKALDYPFLEREEKPEDGLRTFVGEKSLLLVLDNFEHLVENGGPGIAAGLLRAAPNLKMITTSRVRLNIQGERLLPVAGLPYPPSRELLVELDPDDLGRRYSAVLLFAERAARVQPGFSMSQTNAREVVRVCELIDGLPLGIELAAAWLEVLTPAEIAAEISSSLAFLASDLQDLPERQRSLRAIYDSSLRFLSEEERFAVTRLSAFEGAFSRAAAQEIGQCPLHTLLGLTNKSWLQHSPDGYFSLHPLLQYFLRAELAQDLREEKRTLELMAGYYAGFLEAQNDRLRGPAQKRSLDVIEAEWANIRMVFHGLVVGGRLDVITQRMLPALVWFAFIRDHLDDLIDLCRLGGSAGENPVDPLGPERIILRIAAAWSMSCYAFWATEHSKELDALRKLVQEENLRAKLGFWYILLAAANVPRSPQEASGALEAVSVNGESTVEPWWRGQAMLYLSLLLHEQGAAAGEQWAERALEIFNRQGGPFEQAQAMVALANYRIQQRNYPEAQRLLDHAGDIFLDIGARAPYSDLLRVQNNLFRLLGKHQELYELSVLQIRSFERAGDWSRARFGMHWLSINHSRYGSLEEAFILRRRAMEIMDYEGKSGLLAWDTWELGELYRLKGAAVAAEKEFKKALALFRDHGFRLGIGFYKRGMGEIARQAGDHRRAYRRFKEYLSCTENFSWSEAHARASLGRAAVVLDRLDEADHQFLVAEGIAESLGEMELEMIVNLGRAEAAAARGNHERAAALAEQVIGHHASWHETRQDAQDLLAALPGKPGSSG